MTKRLQLGIIGLGGRWVRYRRALLALAHSLRVTAVHDPRPDRTHAEAADLKCRPIPGVVELVRRDDVDAVLLAGQSWFGLWPLLHAVQAEKPILCAVSPVEDVEHIEALLEQLPPQAPVHVVLWPALTIGVEFLGTALAETLGDVRLVQVHFTRRTDEMAQDAMLSSASLLALLHGCADLTGATPEAIHCLGAARQPGFTDLVLEFTGGAVAQLTLWQGRATRNETRLQVEGEKSVARLTLPRSIEWNDGEARYGYTLPHVPVEFIVLDRFARAIREGRPPTCDLASACAALGWLRAARQSREEGRRVLLTS